MTDKNADKKTDKKTDKELLQLAAKAAGATWVDDCWPEDLPGLMLDFGKGTTQWNPLNDDGDALRLAVKLGMLLEVILPQEKVIAWSEDEQRTHVYYGEAESATSKDCYEATRRAIVRAAAAIGATTKEPK